MAIKTKKLKSGLWNMGVKGISSLYQQVRIRNKKATIKTESVEKSAPVILKKEEMSKSLETHRKAWSCELELSIMLGKNVNFSKNHFVRSDPF